MEQQQKGTTEGHCREEKIYIFLGSKSFKMQRVTSSIEDEMIVKAIKEDAVWETLPKRLRLFLQSNEEYQKRVKEYCIKKRLKWSDCAARNACKEAEYYEDLVRYLRKNLALFPYHLAENMCRIQRLTPFRYYCDILYEVMRNERPYDSIPNFSAADALRLTGVGRNEFIDIMNKCRGKKLMWKLNKSIARDMLPTTPVDFLIEPWWTVSIVNLSVEEFRKLSDDEMVVIDKVGKEELNLVAELDLEVVCGLYRRGLIYFEVPVYPDDHFQVSNLDGFVSNRDQGYEDPTEELLYAVFVASSEQATVGELAHTLQADLEQLEAAVSLACRLGWAKKVLDPASLLNDSSIPGSPLSEDSGGDDGFRSMPPSPFTEGMSEPDGDSIRSHQFGITRFAFMVDANLTSYLMMGSLSPGLKGHAVTLYEAGKLGDSSVAEMCEDLRQVEGTKFEGELQNLADHAFSLRQALECLRSTGTVPEAPFAADAEPEPDSESRGKSSPDLIDFELGPSAIALNKPSHLSSFNFGEELGGDELGEQSRGRVDGGEDLFKFAAVQSSNDFSVWGDHDKIATPDIISDMRPSTSSSAAAVNELTPLDVSSPSPRARRSTSFSPAADNELTPLDVSSPRARRSISSVADSETTPLDISSPHARRSISSLSAADTFGHGRSRNRKGGRRHRVDVLRVESLESLSSGTIHRVLHRDYDVVVSMIPLPSPPSVVSADGLGPVQFGPPSRAAITPWMKLLLYSVSASGPVSVALIRGMRIRLLPPPLAGCEKALVWTWDGVGITGVGGKVDGSLIEGRILLHVLNTLLKFSAVLVQPLSSSSLDESGNVSSKKMPLPLRDQNGAVQAVDSSDVDQPITSLLDVVDELNLYTVGYIHTIRVCKAKVNAKGKAVDESSTPEIIYEWVPQSVEFGIPLFDTELCKLVCDGAIRRELFHNSTLPKHKAAMQKLRRKLREFISEHQANGAVSRAAYPGEEPKPGRKPVLLKLASSKWNPSDGMFDPLTPTAGLSSPSYSEFCDQFSPSFKYSKQSIPPIIPPSPQQQEAAESSAGSGSTEQKMEVPEITGSSVQQQKNDYVEDDDGSDVPLPGVNLIFDGQVLKPLNMARFLQGRLPVLLVAEAAVASELYRVPV